MKLNKVLLSGVIALSCVSASAQEADKTVNVFTPHWYAQAQVGGQYTLGEIGFGKLLSPKLEVTDVRVTEDLWWPVHIG